MDPLIITVAAVGAELTREQQPGLPVTPEEVARDAEECAAAGASIYHLHVRDDLGAPTMDVSRFDAVHRAIKQRTDLIVQFTSGGAASDPEEARVAPLSLEPEMATLTTGTVNFGDEIFANPRPLVERFYVEMRKRKILPEFEIFEPGMIANALGVFERHGDDHHLHFDFVLGVPGAMPAWPDSLGFLTKHLPADASWSATGIGKSHVPVATETIAVGGHVRTGFEDVRYMGPGELARTNAQLIARVSDMAKRAGRGVATPQEARAILGLQAIEG